MAGCEGPAEELWPSAVLVTWRIHLCCILLGGRGQASPHFCGIQIQLGFCPAISSWSILLVRSAPSHSAGCRTGGADGVVAVVLYDQAVDSFKEEAPVPRSRRNPSSSRNLIYIYIYTYIHMYIYICGSSHFSIKPSDLPVTWLSPVQHGRNKTDGKAGPDRVQR